MKPCLPESIRTQRSQEGVSPWCHQWQGRGHDHSRWRGDHKTQEMVAYYTEIPPLYSSGNEGPMMLCVGAKSVSR